MLGSLYPTEEQPGNIAVGGGYSRGYKVSTTRVLMVLVNDPGGLSHRVPAKASLHDASMKHVKVKDILSNENQSPR